MKKTPYVKSPAEFPLSRSCRILGLFMVILSAAAAVVALALIIWLGLLLDESSIVEIPGPVSEALLPVVWAALGVLAVSSVLIALVYSSWAAAGRRDLYHAAGGELQHHRPTDRQMRWFLRDVPPREAAAVTILAWACLGTLIGVVAPLAIHFGGRAEERASGHLMLGLALISAVTIAACIQGSAVCTLLDWRALTNVKNSGRSRRIQTSANPSGDPRAVRPAT